MTDIKPEFVYKYGKWDKNGSERIITGSTIKLTSPSEFNDPYDCGVPIRYDLLSEDDMYKLSKEKHPNCSEEFHQRQVKFAMTNTAKKLKAGKHDEMFRKEINYWKDVLGIFCASENYSNILLWSHYADNHRGFCVKLKSEGIFYAAGYMVGSVIYKDEIPELLPGYNKNMDEEHKTTIQQFFSKYSGWSYEEEIRFIGFKKANKIVEIDPQTIEAVYFGWSMPPEDKSKKLKELQELEHLKHIKYYEMKINSTKYELEAVEFES